MITAAKVTEARTVNGRVLLGARGLEGEQRSRVRLLVPPGITAIPAAGSDLVLVEVGTRDHVVALGGSRAADCVTGLEPGDVAMSGHGQRVVIKADGVHVLEALKVVIQTAGAVEVEAASVVVTSPSIKLGSAAASQPVKLGSGANATKVFAE